MWRYFAIISIFSIFFLLIPGFGAFYVRGQWRRFRREITDSSLLPQVNYSRLAQHADGFVGHYRFFGALEAIQGDDIIWLRSGNISLSAELADVDIYLLPSFSHAENEGIVERNEEALPDEMPQRIPWHRVLNLPEGTSVFLSGPFFAEHGQGVFKKRPDHPLTVVFYDGAADSILRRSIWGARQRNEYWNRFTPASLIAGTLGLLVLAYNFITSAAAAPAVLALALCTTPALPFAPPGLPLYLAYRYLWKRARFSRAERDILRLPVRYSGYQTESRPVEALLPDGGRYSVEIFDTREEALGSMETRKVRTTSLLRAFQDLGRRYYVFGASRYPKDRKKRGHDSMVEQLLIPGEPLALAARCVRRARAFEILAALCFGACYAINAIGALILFNLWVV